MMRRAFAAAAFALVAVACQPTAPTAGTTPTETGSDEPRLGAPDTAGVPQSIDALVQLTEPEAVEWQDDPRLVQIDVGVDAEGEWTSATATYVAPDADRLVDLLATSDGVVEQRLTLSTLQLQPVPAEALDEVPPLPDDLPDPAVLLAAAGEAVTECLGAPPAKVLYASGAPFGWDGTQWASPPRWTVTVTSDADDSPTATIDPASAEVSGCA